jgi:hypothetical protein
VKQIPHDKRGKAIVYNELRDFYSGIGGKDTVHLDGQLSVVDVLRSRRQQRLAREANHGGSATS